MIINHRTFFTSIRLEVFVSAVSIAVVHQTLNRFKTLKVIATELCGYRANLGKTMIHSNKY